MVGLSASAQAQLALLRTLVIDRGDVFWLPGTVIIYRGLPKERPCLVAAVDAARAYLIVGTGQTATGPAVVVQPTEVNVRKRTEFDFSTHFTLTFTELATHGEHAGRLAPERIAEIDEAIRKSDRVALKRLISR